MVSTLSQQPDAEAKARSMLEAAPVLDAAGYCPACTFEAVKLDSDGRFWWLQTFGQLGDHQVGCANEGGPTLANLRLVWLELQAILRPNRRCAIMPHEPQPEFWMSHRPPSPRRDYSGPSPYQRIKSTVRIEEVASMLGVQLRSYGNRERGRCPLHEERSPSFTIYTDQQSFYCYGCNRGGDVIDLLSEAGRLDEFMAATR